jgi:hypothetical protein
MTRQVPVEEVAQFEATRVEEDVAEIATHVPLLGLESLTPHFPV